MKVSAKPIVHAVSEMTKNAVRQVGKLGNKAVTTFCRTRDALAAKISKSGVTKKLNSSNLSDGVNSTGRAGRAFAVGLIGGMAGASIASSSDPAATLIATVVLIALIAVIVIPIACV